MPSLSSAPRTRQARSKAAAPGPLPPAHHLHHAHLFSALAILGVAAAMAIVTNYSASAQIGNLTQRNQKTVCEDPDRTNINEVGKTTVYQLDKNNKKGRKTIEKTDACVSENKVREYYCTKEGTLAEKEVVCPKNTRCAKGACVVPPPKTITPPPPAVSSYELQQQGVTHLWQPGMHQGTDNSWCETKTINNQVVCSDSLGVKLAPSCSGDVPTNPSCGGKPTSPGASTFTNVRCYPMKSGTNRACGADTNAYGGKYKCAIESFYTGATVQAYCKDPGASFSCSAETDGGNNPAVAGSLTIKNNFTNVTNQKNDFCTSDKELKELFCSTDLFGHASSTVSCGTGICYNNACQAASSTALSITAAWAGDTPSGASAPGANMTVGKIVISVPQNIPNYIILRSLNFVLRQTGFNWSYGSNVKVYKDSVASSNLLASGRWEYWRGATADNTSFTLADFADNYIVMNPGESKTFFVTVDTQDAGVNDNLSISMEADDVVWSVGTAQLTNMGVSGLPLTPKVFTF